MDIKEKGSVVNPEKTGKKITTTREKLATAFEKWMEDYNENPGMFDTLEQAGKNPKTYGEACADHLIKRLGK